MRLAASETERQALLDRLLAKNRVEPVTPPVQQAKAASEPRVIAPPWAGFAEVQDAQRDIFLKEETEYLMSEHDWEYGRARAEAEERYKAQYGVSVA